MAAKARNGQATRLADILPPLPAKTPAEDLDAQITWQMWPDEIGRHFPWELLRIKKPGVRDAIVVSHQVLGTKTHYWGGRTWPCLKNACKACAAGRGKEWHGYLFVTNLAAEHFFLMELPSTAASYLKKWYDEHRTLRGLRIDARRRNGRDNGPVVLENLRKYELVDNLPKAPSTRDALVRLWKLSDTLAQLLLPPTPEDLAAMPELKLRAED